MKGKILSKNSPYADETFYNNNYLDDRPAVITVGLSFYLQKATNIINKYIGTNITDITDDVKMCCCEVADLLYTESTRGNKTSENNDGYSITWDLSKTAEKQIVNIISTWLDNEYLYAGVYRYDY